jgi:hypothetical protein
MNVISSISNAMAPVALAVGQGGVISGAKRKREELNPGICGICMNDDSPRETVFIGCGHMIACLDCVQTLQRQLNRDDFAAKCPTCRVISLPVRVIVS